MRSLSFKVSACAVLFLAVGCGDAGTPDDQGHFDVGQDVCGDCVGVDIPSGDVHQDIVVADVVNPDTTVQDLPVEVIPEDVGDDVPVVDVSEDASEPVNIGQNPLTSPCGGFVDLSLPAFGADQATCGDDVLHWSVDADNGLIHFTNYDVFLNCCGVHDVIVFVQDGTYVIREIDEPEDGGGRCNCMCLFDYSVDLPLTPDTVINVRVERLITDSDGVLTAWEGQIDQAPGSGDIVIEEDVGWCFDSVDIGVNAKFSDCGGFTPPVETQVIRPVEGDGCVDEILAWSFDEGMGTVAFVNSGVALNCCGIHEMAVYLDDDVYTLKEIDGPDDGSGRCKCMCSFDFSIDLPGMFVGTIHVRLVREITDSDLPPVFVWEGIIDLSDGSGQELLREDSYCL